jgi:hypothetical protein
VFLQPIVRHVLGKLLLIWDGAPIHRCHEVKQFLTEGAAKRLKLLPLPGYAPDLNPDEGVWRCPYCGRPHAHYGGPLETDPSQYLNHPVTPSCNADAQGRSAPDTPATVLQYILRVKEPS